MDPSGQESAPYAYASCDPINGLDPTGLNCTKAIADLVFAGIGTVASVVGIVLSVAAEIPSAGAATALGVASVLGFSASAYGVVSAIGSVMTDCD